ncbi:MAG: HD-GYP domain-containing protein [Lachnospiraceae bacterium]|mgnify:CR=1 FL=1|nr:HD-GYP domain-containing protein [Lachnospiraceae bacterium]
MQMMDKARLCPGMILGQDVYNFANQIVVKKGTVLDERTITKLHRFEIPQFMIKEEVLSVQEANTYHKSSYSERIQNSPEFKRFQENYDIEVLQFQNMLTCVIEKNQEIDCEALYHQVVLLLKDTGNTINAFDMVQNLRHYDDSTYAHSMNVGLLCNVFADWLGFDEEDKKKLTVAGILHDIGKTRIPLDIIQKPSSLSEEEYQIIKKHTEYGFAILTENKLDYHIRYTALQHHERNDGSGYPLGLVDDHIDEFAKIVSIVDVYDAMTSPRVYRGPMCPFDVIQLFEEEGFRKYDSAYILTFLKRIAESYLNEQVRLSDGRIGKLVFINVHALSRPVVMVGDQVVDLQKEKHLHIREIL